MPERQQRRFLGDPYDRGCVRQFQRKDCGSSKELMKSR